MRNKYRRCVGMMILNTNNEILVGRRLDHENDYWQMPQGGIDENENPEEAVWREMMEEIGTNNAQLFKTSNQWIDYEIPQETLNKIAWGETYNGQTQKWFIFKFSGQNSDINIETTNPEFSEWKWIGYKELVNNTIPFKRNVYETILKEFSNIF